jgi:hypothetical protein
MRQQRKEQLEEVKRLQMRATVAEERCKGVLEEFKGQLELREDQLRAGSREKDARNVQKYFEPIVNALRHTPTKRADLESSSHMTDSVYLGKYRSDKDYLNEQSVARDAVPSQAESNSQSKRGLFSGEPAPGMTASMFGRHIVNGYTPRATIEHTINKFQSILPKPKRFSIDYRMERGKDSKGSLPFGDESYQEEAPQKAEIPVAEVGRAARVRLASPVARKEERQGGLRTRELSYQDVFLQQTGTLYNRKESKGSLPRSGLRGDSLARGGAADGDQFLLEFNKKVTLLTSSK